MSILGVIPSRYASTRFPGKPLAMINGRSMLQRVYEQAKKATLLDDVIIATDDQRIMDHALTFNARVVMTGMGHPSGTDRCYDAYKQLEQVFEYVLNIQGDEPFLDPLQIDGLAKACDGEAEICTQMVQCTDHEVLFDTGEVKIVLNENQEALYFSRTVIPFMKNFPEKEWHLHHKYFRHVGMYAYRTDILEKLSALKLSSLEKAESLEQLRWLENGYKIKCVPTEFDSHCVDTPEDIPKVLRLMKISE